MIKIGITGGIGSGKSTVAKMLKDKGYETFNCDDAAREVRNKRQVQNLIVEAFGETVLSENPYSESVLDEYYLDSGKLAMIVFQNPDKMKTLVDIVHPEVRKKLEEWYDIQENGLGIALIEKKVFVENAIIFETNTQNEFDEVLTVHAPEEERIERVMNRDNCTLETVKMRMAAQVEDDYRLNHSDYVIYNYGDHDLEKQVDLYIKRLTTK